MKFYIYQNSSWVQKKANLTATATDVKDETLDTASVTLMFDERKDPYKARSLCKIYYSDDDIDYYHIALDNVEVQTLSPLTYKHTLSLVQTTRKLSHHILPNCKIEKPREGAGSTYFANENVLCVAHYWGDACDPSLTGQGLRAWDGFTTRCGVSISNPASYRSTDAIMSPYWGECLAWTNHSTASSARVKINFTALYATGSAQGEPTNVSVSYLTRQLASPSWLTPYIRVYWTRVNVNSLFYGQTIKDSDFEVIAKIPMNSSSSRVKWGGEEYAYIDLTADEIAKMNAKTSGYIMCDIVSEVTGTLPNAFYGYNDDGTTYEMKATFDRLFVDKSEFTNNGIQCVWSKVRLEVTYQTISLYGALLKIVERYQCNLLGDEIDGHTEECQNAPLYRLPSSGDDYDTLTKTASPEFQFNGCTVFEAVSQVLETIDALPRFACDDEGNLTLELEYFEDDNVSEVPANTTWTSYVSNDSEQKKDNGIVTNFQSAETLNYFPCKPTWRSWPNYTRARVKDYGVPELTSFGLIVDKPIKSIKELWVQCTCTFNYIYADTETTQEWGEYDWTYGQKSFALPIEISSFIFEEAVYSSALAQNGSYPHVDNHITRLQMNCIKYRKGGTAIDVGVKASDNWNNAYNTFWKTLDDAVNRTRGIYGQNQQTASSTSPLATVNWYASIAKPTQNDFKNVFFWCAYVSDHSGRLIVQSPFDKENGEFNASTSSSSPDLGKLGLNMLGISLRSGEPTMTTSQTLTEWDKRIKIGDTFTLEGDYWVATKAQYTLIGSGDFKNVIKGTIEFTKNFNGLSKRISINQQTRLYNIDRSISCLCEVNPTQYVYFEPLAYGDTPEGMNEQGFISLFTPFYDRLPNILMRPFTASKGDGNAQYQSVDYAIYQRSEEINKGIFIPVTTYGAGNCICFETKFNDPVSAGIAMYTGSAGENLKWWASSSYATAWNNTYYYGSDVKYTDDEGYQKSFTIYYYTANTGGLFEDSNDFPLVSDVGHSGYKLGQIDLTFDKSPNEIVAVNMELALLSRYHKPNNEVFINKRYFDYFTERNGLVPKDIYFKYWTGEGETFSKTGKKPSVTATGSFKISSITWVRSNGELCLMINHASTRLSKLTQSIHSFGLFDDNTGECLIGCNFDTTITLVGFGGSDQLPKLHFFPRVKRL
jgi:hypothetical protein